MTRRCARWWFLRGLYIGHVAGWVCGVGWHRAEVTRCPDFRADRRWLMRLWRDLGRPAFTPEGP